MNYDERSLKMHEDYKGKIEVISKVKVESKDDLSIAYTPGVAEPCRKINANKEDVAKTLKLPNFNYKLFEEITGITKKMITDKLK